MKSRTSLFTNLIALLMITLISNQGLSQCYELVWAEEFNYSGLPDERTWGYDVGGDGWGNNELQYYTYRDVDNVSVENGRLVITARKENFGGRAYTSTRLKSQGLKSFKYGKMEARMKLPYGKGIWPAFWMLGNSFSTVGWPACGEIDIMEMVGGTGGDNTTHGTIHYDNNGWQMYGGSKTLSSGIFADDYHLFSIEWDSQAISWFLDGVQFHVVSITPGYLTEFHEEFFFILNLAVGGNWPGSPDASTVFPQTYEIDYVRVYQEGGNPEISGTSKVSPSQTGLLYTIPFNDDRVYNWSVPSGATIASGQGTDSITVDWGCTTGEVTCDLTTSCGNYQLSFPVTLETEIAGDLFIDPNQTGIQVSVPQMSNSIYDWTVPAGASITSGQGTNSITVDWGPVEDSVYLTITNDCGTNALSRYMRFYGQYAYPDPAIPQAIPGTVESVLYDYGGEGVAYHDNSSQNEGPGIRQDEGVDTEFSDGIGNVGWIVSGEWIEYSIDVQATDIYDVEIRVATNNASGGPFHLLFNGVDQLGGISVPNTGGWGSFISIFPGEVVLGESDTLMRFEATTGGFNMGSIIFTSQTTGISETANISTKVFPNPVMHQLHVESEIPVSRYVLTDLSGRSLQSRNGIGEKQFKINVETFKPGIYLLILVDQANHQSIQKIIKH